MTKYPAHTIDGFQTGVISVAAAVKRNPSLVAKLISAPSTTLRVYGLDMNVPLSQQRNRTTLSQVLERLPPQARASVVHSLLRAVNAHHAFAASRSGTPGVLRVAGGILR